MRSEAAISVKRGATPLFKGSKFQSSKVQRVRNGNRVISKVQSFQNISKFKGPIDRSFFDPLNLYLFEPLKNAYREREREREREVLERRKWWDFSLMQRSDK
jgi:hypothetical protein